MAATAIDPTKRFIRPNVTKVYWLPTVADKSSVTRAELDAGSDLTAEIAEVSGWSTTSENVDVPDLASRFTAKVPGRISAEDSSLTFYASSDTQDVRQLLSRDDTGFVVWMDGGDVATQLMDVFPATVSSLAHQRSVSDAAQIQVNFTITSVPSEQQAIPATV